jgi:hypothetical protein
MFHWMYEKIINTPFFIFGTIAFLVFANIVFLVISYKSDRKNGNKS